MKNKEFSSLRCSLKLQVYKSYKKNIHPNINGIAFCMTLRFLKEAIRLNDNTNVAYKRAYFVPLKFIIKKITTK